MSTETIHTAGKTEATTKTAANGASKKEGDGGGGSGGGGKKKGPSIATLARQMIKKITSQDPVRPTFTTMAHIPSGSIVVNNLIGGSKSADGKGQVCPGFPRRRIVELYGAESCGKTTLALSAIVQCQRAGGVAMILDFEHALHDGYARAVGVDFDPEKLLYYKPDTLEEGFKMIYLGIRTGVDLIVIDSVASMIPKDEFEKKIDDAERVGSLAAPLTRNLKKLAIWLDKYPDKKTESDKPGASIIFINQTRAKIGGGGYGGDEDQTPGGKALKFYSSIRLRMTRIKSEIFKKKNPATGKDINIPYGNITSIRVVKSKIDSKAGQEGVIFIRFGSGLDDLFSVIESGVQFRHVKKEGAYFQYGEHRCQGREKFRTFLKENPKELAELQAKVVESMFASSVEVKPAEEQSAEDALAAEIAADIGDDESFGSDTDEELEVLAES